MITRVCAITVILLLALAACEDDPLVETPAAQQTEERALVQDRFRVRESALDHAGTLSALYQAIDRRDLSVFAVIDHQANAESANLEMPASTLVIFGEPRAGTRLMNALPLLGAELPMRALVYERDGQAFIAVTGTDYLRRAYGLDAQTELLDRIGDTLAAITDEATAR